MNKFLILVFSGLTWSFQALAEDQFDGFEFESNFLASIEDNEGCGKSPRENSSCNEDQINLSENSSDYFYIIGSKTPNWRDYIPPEIQYEKEKDFQKRKDFYEQSQKRFLQGFYNPYQQYQPRYPYNTNQTN